MWSVALHTSVSHPLAFPRTIADDKSMHIYLNLKSVDLFSYLLGEKETRVLRQEPLHVSSPILINSNILCRFINLAASYIGVSIYFFMEQKTEDRCIFRRLLQ